MVMVYWVRIVSTSSARWVGDRRTSSSLPSSSQLFFPRRVVVVVTLLVLSFFSVDGLQRTDFGRAGPMRALATETPFPSHYYPFPSGERTKGAMRRILASSLAKSRHGRRGKRRHGGDSGGGGSPSPRVDSIPNRGDRGKKREADRGMGMVRDLDWESVLILDEHELDDEAEAGKTRIHLFPEGRHVSTFLNRGMNGRFLFLNSKQNGSLSLVITPCSSTVIGSISFLSLSENTTRKYVALKRSKVLETFRTQRTVSYNNARTQRGVYMLELRPLYSNSYVHLFLTTEPEYSDPFDVSLISSDGGGAGNDSDRDSSGPGLHIHNFLNTNHVSPKPWVGVKKLRRQRIQVKWDPSPLNPHRMNYCIVINTRRDYASLCGATGDKFGFLPPDLRHLPIYPYYPEESQPDPLEGGQGEPEGGQGQTSSVGIGGMIQGRTKSSDDIVVGCLRKRTNYILSNLHEGVLYYVNIFVKDVATGLSYPYVRTMLKYTTPTRSPNHLSDAKPMKVVLGEEMVTLSFNVKRPCSELSLYLMPCGGGLISYKILTSNHTLYEASDVDSLDIIKMAFPLRGKYYIKVGQGGARARATARMAEVFVSKKQKKFPLPKLPAVTTVFELENERRCDTVTIQWWASPDLRDNEYCLFLKEETRKRGFHFKKPNQCDVERSLQSDPYVSLSFCIQKTPSETEGKLLKERITGLKPGTAYILQLIVKRHNGKSALSYDLTLVATSHQCLDELI